MCKVISTLMLLSFVGAANCQPSVGPSPLDWAKKKCAELGFKAGTERLGNCVLQLSRDEISNNNSKPVLNAPKLTIATSPKNFKDCDECPEMVLIKAGKFLMGSKADPFAKRPPSTDEMPQHEVSIKSFSLGKLEVTQEQWYEVMGTLPSKFKGRTLPVDQVSWNDVQEFLKKLSEKTSKKYRLPSEAEWEYAARGGSQTAYSFGDDEKQLNLYGWYEKNSGMQSHPVGVKLPNAFGLHDTHGNVSEFVQDCWNDNYVNAPNDGSARKAEGCTNRVYRGGAASNPEHGLRAADRWYIDSAVPYALVGFRIARDN